MNSTPWEFRYRLWISTAIVLLGFWAPWNRFPAWDARATLTWGWLALELARLGINSTAGFAIVTGLAIAAAALGVVLRVCGTAFLGPETVFNAQLKSSPATQFPVAAGPYRHLRNPLYLGSYLTIAGISILMPPSGAAVILPLLAIFLLRLTLAEESFLTRKIGAPYTLYRRTVPAFFPTLRPYPSVEGHPPQWLRALLTELFSIGVLITFASLSWQYDPQLLDRAVLISFGASLVVRALILPTPANPTNPTATT